MIKVLLHEFQLSDVEDVELFAAQALRGFIESEQGRWIKENAHDLHYHSMPDVVTLGHRIAIYGYLPEEAASYYALKFS